MSKYFQSGIFGKQKKCVDESGRKCLMLFMSLGITLAFFSALFLLGIYFLIKILIEKFGV